MKTISQTLHRKNIYSNNLFVKTHIIDKIKQPNNHCPDIKPEVQSAKPSSPNKIIQTMYLHFSF